MQKVGQIYCCDNCFRSFHWKCIGQKKIEELSKPSYVMNFICESCETQNNCTKCNSTYPKQRFQLLDFSDDSSIFTLYKCTHCYSKIHKKCFEVPIEILNKKLFQKENNRIKLVPKSQTINHYLCQKCIQAVGITEIVATQRLCNNLGVESLYYYVMLNTNSPTHKGWVEEYVLRSHLKKFSSNQTFITDFLQNSQLHEYPEIEKILAIRFPAKYKNTSISEVPKIIQAKNKLSLNERYGHPDNFKFLVKWKQRDYTSLTWQDQTIVLRQTCLLKRFLKQKQNQCFLVDYVKNVHQKKNQNKPNPETNYKVLEYYLNNQPKITEKFLTKKKQIQLFHKNSVKTFEQKMCELDEKNINTNFIEIIGIESQKTFHGKEIQNYDLIIKYLQKCYHSEIILRPTLIISDNINIWEESIKSSFQKIHSLPLRVIKFFGSKNNTDSIKSSDFFISMNPHLFRFDVILIDYNYFLFENNFLFENIPSIFITIFDGSTRFHDLKQRLKFIQKAFVPYKSKVQKEIYLIESGSKVDQTQNFITNLLNINSSSKNSIKKCVFHDISFSTVKQYTNSESNLKVKLEKRYKDTINILSLGSKQMLNQSQRLSFLKFIMAFGLNIKKVDDMCNRMRAANPTIWNMFDVKKMAQIVEKYLSLFMVVISNSYKDTTKKMNHASMNYFLFNYQSENVLKRIIQLKKLKTQVEKSFDDHSKFVIKKPFMFFSSGQCKPFPLWNTYEDYTLGALIVEEGYHMWSNIIKSKKWIDYHSELQTRKIFQFDPRVGTFTVQQKIVPIKKKVLQNQLQNQPRIIQHVNPIIFQESKSSSVQIKDIANEKQQVSQSYGQYLLRKIRNSKQFKDEQYGKLEDLNILQGHIAERGDSILMSLGSQ